MKMRCGTILVAAAWSGLAAGQTPDLSGTWKLNLTASSFGGEHVAADYGLTKIITAQGKGIRITDSQTHHARMNIPFPDSKTTSELVADGKEYEAQVEGMFPGRPPTPVLVSTEWQGGTLFVKQMGRTSGSASTTYIRYYLSADSSQLIERVESHKPFGDSEQQLVFDRTR